MLVAAICCAVGLVVVAWALYRDDPVPEPGARREPDWGPLPEPADLLRLEFPRAMPGYDPASVDAHVDALAVAYRDLLAEAPPEIVARARRRAAARQGIEPTGEPPVAATTATGSASPADTAAPAAATAEATVTLEGALGKDGDPAAEALRAEAALAVLRSVQHRTPGP